MSGLVIDEATERSVALRGALAERIVIADGAMGTMLQAYDLTTGDFDGHEGCNEVLNVTRPDVVSAIHRAYLAAGADCVTTNTSDTSSVSASGGYIRFPCRCPTMAADMPMRHRPLNLRPLSDNPPTPSCSSACGAKSSAGVAQQLSTPLHRSQVFCSACSTRGTATARDASHRTSR